MNSEKYIGLDVHQATISVAVMDSAGKLAMESILETKAATSLQFFAGLRGTLWVTFEEGTCAAWLYDLLHPHVAHLVVCNPRKNALLKYGNKSDRIDARKLAELLRGNHVKPVYHGENGVRTLRELARSYLTTVVSASLDSLPAVLIEHRPSVLWFSGHGRDDPAGLLLADNHWLTPEQLCSALLDVAAQGGRTPLYVILWACQTGSPARFAARGPAPEFVKALHEVGVTAILASQAPLSDKAALLAAKHVLSALAAGRPLDHAARAFGPY